MMPYSGKMGERWTPGTPHARTHELVFLLLLLLLNSPSPLSPLHFSSFSFIHLLLSLSFPLHIFPISQTGCILAELAAVVAVLLAVELALTAVVGLLTATAGAATVVVVLGAGGSVVSPNNQ